MLILEFASALLTPASKNDKRRTWCQRCPYTLAAPSVRQGNKRKDPIFLALVSIHCSVPGITLKNHPSSPPQHSIDLLRKSIEQRWRLPLISKDRTPCDRIQVLAECRRTTRVRYKLGAYARMMADLDNWHISTRWPALLKSVH